MVRSQRVYGGFRRNVNQAPVGVCLHQCPAMTQKSLIYMGLLSAWLRKLWRYSKKHIEKTNEDRKRGNWKDIDLYGILYSSCSEESKRGNWKDIDVYIVLYSSCWSFQITCLLTHFVSENVGVRNGKRKSSFPLNLELVIVEIIERTRPEVKMVLSKRSFIYQLKKSRDKKLFSRWRAKKLVSWETRSFERAGCGWVSSKKSPDNASSMKMRKDIVISQKYLDNTG